MEECTRSDLVLENGAVQLAEVPPGDVGCEFDLEKHGERVNKTLCDAI